MSHSTFLALHLVQKHSFLGFSSPSTAAPSSAAAASLAFLGVLSFCKCIYYIDQGIQKGLILLYRMYLTWKNQVFLGACFFSVAVSSAVFSSVSVFSGTCSISTFSPSVAIVFCCCCAVGGWLSARKRANSEDRGGRIV